MPFVKDDTVRPPSIGFAPDNRPPPTFGETVAAAFRQENIIGSIAANGAPLVFNAVFGSGVDPSFDPLADKEALKGYENELTAFSFANSVEEVERVKAQIDRERADRETLRRAGITGFVAAMGAGILDPTVFVPVGGQIRKGETFLRASSRLAVAAGVGVTAQEAGLHATQETRTLEESVFAIGGSVLLGAALGGGVSMLSKRQFADLAARVDQDMRAGERGGGGGLSAEAKASTTLADETIAGIEGFAKGLGVMDPVIRLQTSPSLVARKLGQSLAEGSLALQKNLPRTVEGPDGPRLELGQPTQQAVESFIRRKTEVFNGEILKGLDDAYAKYHFGRDRKPLDITRAGVKTLTGALGGKLSRGQFFEEVSKAMRRGDKHQIPEVQAEAQRIRPYFETLVDEGVELGMFGVKIANPERAFGEAPVYEAVRPSVADTAESYLARIYDHDKIIRHEDEFVDIVAAHYREERDKAAAEIGRHETELATLVRPEIEALRSAVRSLVKERDGAFRKGRDEIEKAKAELAKAKVRAKESGTQAIAADKRVQELASRMLTPEQDAYYTGLAADLARGHGDYKPLTLSQFIRKQGGIKDWDSMHSNEHLKGRRLISPKGLPLDTLREIAVEAKYFPEDGTLAQFVDAIDDDASGRFVYSEHDLDQVAYNEWLTEVNEAATKDGIDVSSVIDLANWHMSAKYAEKTKFKSGRLAEAEKRERYALGRFENARDQTDLADMALAEARAMARTLRTTSPELTARINEYRKELAGRLRERDRLKSDLAKNELRADMSDVELRDVAVRTKQRILSGPAGRLSYDGGHVSRRGGVRRNDPAISGRFKARVLKILDERIEKFLVNDIERVVRATAHGMIPDIELTKRFGSLDMELSFKELADDFQKLNDAVAEKLSKTEQSPTAAEAAKSKAREEAGETRKAIDNQRRQAERDLIGIRDRLRGVYGLPDDPNQLGFRVIRNALTFNHLRLGGGFTVSSFPDAARVVFENGVENFMGPALAVFTGKLGTIRLAASEVKHAGPAFEMVNNSRLSAMADLMDDYGRTGKVERVLDNAKANFGMISLMTPWNHMMKTATGLTVQNRIIKAAGNLKKGRISKKDAIYLARLGIGQEDALKIADLYRQHGQDVDGVKWANTRDWGDKDLADVFHNAMRKEIDRVIVTPGQEKPLIMSGPLGRLFGQFRSYNFAATQRVLLAASQGLAFGDAQVLMTLLSQISLGMMVAKMKAEANDTDTSAWEARRWVVEGIDRSGVMAVLTEVNMISEHMTRGRVGLSAIGGQGLISRYHSRNLIGALAGPAAGFVGDLQQGSAALTSGEQLTEGDVAALRRLLPYQNLIGARHLFDAAEENLAAAVAR